LPPPVMMESTAFVEPATIMLCCNCAMCFCAAASSENDHGSMNFDSNTAPVLLDQPVQGRRHPDNRRVEFATLALANAVAGHPLKPEPIEPLGDQPQLNHQVLGQVRWLDLAALLLPQPGEGGFIAAHDDAGIRAADEVAAVFQILVSGWHLRSLSNSK